ncbi:hypothetical protein S7711_05185 [Stachybotrys chartarum IBT 7711]|uniref:Uncharacterized protein n=1 Tax=Stachybotrys chartarum (strain CBS 109288 / IBT 7711) TaxID=1280523 RepID=A0A084ANF1_STACB|nr:hypothetical protein S7711_05185 [Stachybotrys chartarum IBT 7711]KFA53194.1 hypothetical protein S40293_03168 [Stachybotrys chartarum IBT 40293]
MKQRDDVGAGVRACSWRLAGGPGSGQRLAASDDTHGDAARALEDPLLSTDSIHTSTQPPSLRPKPAQAVPPSGTQPPGAMPQRNHTIAIIIIVLFVVLALVSFGIWRLVHVARRNLSVASGSSSSSSRDIADD